MARSLHNNRIPREHKSYLANHFAWHKSVLIDPDHYQGVFNVDPCHRCGAKHSRTSGKFYLYRLTNLKSWKDRISAVVLCRESAACVFRGAVKSE